MHVFMRPTARCVQITVSEMHQMTRRAICARPWNKGFGAQVADVVGGPTAPSHEFQRAAASQSVPGEFSELKRVRDGQPRLEKLFVPTWRGF